MRAHEYNNCHAIVTVGIIMTLSWHCDRVQSLTYMTLYIQVMGSRYLGYCYARDSVIYHYAESYNIWYISIDGLGYRTSTLTVAPRIRHVSHCHRSLWGGGQRVREAAVINSTRLTVAQNSNSYNII